MTTKGTDSSGSGDDEMGRIRKGKMSTMKLSKHMTILVTLALLGFWTDCRDLGTQGPQEENRVTLTLIDVSVTEAFIHIAVTSPVGNEVLSLQRNGAAVMTFSAVADTSIADTALMQITRYQYEATLRAKNEVTGKSNAIAAQTLPPTSHSFSWQTFLLGDGNNSSLNDVAILSDSLIYAVGELYLADTNGTIDDIQYNLAVWTGTSWTIQRVAYLSNGSPFYSPIRWVFALSPNDIWFGNSTRWDGHQLHNVDIGTSIFYGVGSNKMWGSQSGELYAVGNNGAGAYSPNHGATWQRVETGTRIQINDAWGVLNPVTGKEDVYCAVSSFFTPGEKRILKITRGTHVDSIKWDTGRNVFSVWTHNGFPLYTAGSGVFEDSRGSWRESALPNIYSNTVRGTSLADIVVAGDLGFVAHFNGIDWRVFTDVYDAQYLAAAMTNNVVALVGERNGRGVVTIGRRNQ